MSAAAADSRLQPLADDIRALARHMSAGDAAYDRSYNMFDEVGQPQTAAQARAQERAEAEWDAARQSEDLIVTDCELAGAPFTISDG